MFRSLAILLFFSLVLQQIIHVQSLILPIQDIDKNAIQSDFEQRFRAPLISRSLLSIRSENDGFDMNLAESSASSSSSNSDEDSLIYLNKRRQGNPLFGRRWAPMKRRGPLFG